MRFVFLLTMLLAAQLLKAQTVPAGSIKLSADAIQKLLPDSVKKRLGIKFATYAVFEYSDRFKKQYLVLSENSYSREKEQALNDSVQAVLLQHNNGLLQPVLTITDFITPGKNNKGFTDYSIWFWTKYTSIADIDGDGSADPIIVYGTAGENDKEDCKIKIVTCCKGKKFVIRHQNGSLDFERNTHVDKAWYTLPAKIQAKVKSIMNALTANNHAIFPAGWQKAMAAKKTYFDEN
jgi:hypothetical protein